MEKYKITLITFKFRPNYKINYYRYDNLKEVLLKNTLY